MYNEFSKIEQKWGKFTEVDDYFRLICINKEDQSYFHIVFKPNKKYSEIVKNVEESLETSLIPELKEIYKKYNGFRLFDQSINFYGLDDVYYSDYKPSGIFKNNMNYKIKYLTEKSKDLIIFGNYSQWLFCYDKNHYDKILVIDKYDESIVHTFDSIKSLIEFYINYLTDEYDENAIKIHKSKSDIGTMFENRSFEKI